MRYSLIESRSLLGVLLSVLVVAACDDAVVRPETERETAVRFEPTVKELALLEQGVAAGARRVEVQPPSLELRLGGTETLTARVVDAAGLPVETPIVWWSSNPASATVFNGVVQAVDAGWAEVRAYAGPTYAVALVHVADPVTEILLPDLIRVRLGGKVLLEPELRLACGDEVCVPVAWQSMDPTIAVVESNGELRGVKLGTTRIRAVCERATREVNVLVEEPTTRVEIVEPVPDVLVGGYMQLMVKLYDAGGRLLDRKAEWLSSDDTRAKVSESGTVMGFAPGLVTITALSDGARASVTVRVVKPAGVNSMTLEPLSRDIHIGDTVLLTVKLYDATGAMLVRPVTWSSDAPQIAGVQAGLVTGLGLGTAHITATSGGISRTATINVLMKGGDIEEQVVRVFVDPQRREIVVGDRVQFYAHTFDTSGVDLKKPVVWSVDFGPVRIGPDGRADAFGAGTAVIRATVDGVSGTAELIIREPAR